MALKRGFIKIGFGVAVGYALLIRNKDAMVDYFNHK
jgi:hypothetical protein